MSGFLSFSPFFIFLDPKNQNFHVGCVILTNIENMSNFQETCGGFGSIRTKLRFLWTKITKISNSCKTLKYGSDRPTAPSEGGWKRSHGLRKIDFFLPSSKCPSKSPEARRRSNHLILTIFATQKLITKITFFFFLFFAILYIISQILPCCRHIHADHLEKWCGSVEKSNFFELYRFTPPNPHLRTAYNTQTSENVIRNHFPWNSIFSIFALGTPDRPNRLPSNGASPKE